jgi:predicted transcriptional regulator
MSEIKLIVENMDRFFANAREAAHRIDAGDSHAEPALLAFESMEALLKVLTPNRWVLLRRLRSTGPSSVRALAGSLGRDYRGVHADVGALLAVGLIEKRTDGKVVVPWSRITAEMSIDMAA